MGSADQAGVFLGEELVDQFPVEVYASNVPAMATSLDNYLIRSALRARELVIDQKQDSFPLGQATAYNDSNIFRQHSIPAIKCGPSGGKVPADAQSLLDEGKRLSVNDLVNAAKIFVSIAIDICSKDRKEISS